ncbi:2'-5' RNA ligase family protein [Panacibacter sp. DH6]|uniref:2'-5' RNA ligase family protein n=1 Tax=Panacibacter microcysteis TaxID=2793269 RepID=A0A931E2K6_9BACT|nr:2'-5' RNA ligase family protein [Panacibacter microcysteis]MBG9375918.1 2'-5' RNA ligase family protein [Panacibacter microcysteis]
MKRQQLTLFLQPRQAAIIEKIRQHYNPLQHALIKAHITLCRENEIAQPDKLWHNMLYGNYAAFELQFGPPERFDAGRGLWLAALPGQQSFIALREGILKKIVQIPHIPTAHITLIHPRNGFCTDEIFKEVAQYNLPGSFYFDEVSLIEQENGGPWKVLRQAYLRS